MSSAPYLRGTLLVPSGPTGNHLFVVMTNACPDRMHLLVSITSIRPKRKYDDACVFSGGEHPFIKGPSFVLYRMPLQMRVDHIQICILRRTYHVREDMPDAAFKLMCNGFGVSRFTRPWALKYFMANCPLWRDHC